MKERVPIINIALLSAISVVESAHFLINLGLLCSFFPAHSDLDLFQGYRISLHPNRQLFLYQCFLGAAVLLQLMSVAVFKDRLKVPQWKDWGKFLVAEAVWLVLILAVMWEMVIRQYPLPLKFCFYGALLLSHLSRMFWWKIKGFMSGPLFKKFLWLSFGLLPLLLPNSVSMTTTRFFPGIGPTVNGPPHFERRS